MYSNYYDHISKSFNKEVRCNDMESTGILEIDSRETNQS